MIPPLALLWYVVTGLARRAMGGWLGLPRAACLGVLIALSAGPFWWRWPGLNHAVLYGFDLGFPEFLLAVGATGAVWLHWTCGHHFADEDGKPTWTRLVLRYSYCPWFLTALTGAWPLVLVGPAIALFTLPAYVFVGDDRIPCPWDTQSQQMLGGWWPVCELFAVGGLSGLGFFLAATW